MRKPERSAGAQYWEDHAALCGSVLVFNTGRSLGQIRALLDEKRMLAVPDALITAVGTKVRSPMPHELAACTCTSAISTSSQGVRISTEPV